MFTEAVSPAFAAQLEGCEVNAWLDMYAAIPADFARQFGFRITQVQNVVMTSCQAIPFVHFNCVKNLGMNAPASEILVDELIATYHAAGVQHFTALLMTSVQPRLQLSRQRPYRAVHSRHRRGDLCHQS